MQKQKTKKTNKKKTKELAFLSPLYLALLPSFLDAVLGQCKLPHYL